MLVLSDLPPELLLLTTASFGLSDIHALRLTSHFWNAFVAQHSDALFRSAAVHHGFVPDGVCDVGEVARGMAVMALNETGGWERLCQRFTELDDSWRTSWATTKPRGHKPSHRLYTAPGDQVHRFKLVPDDQLSITTRHNPGATPTNMDGGRVTVSDLRTDTVLWSVPSRANAHVEYDAGFLVFDRVGDMLEVWRRASDVHKNPLPPVVAAQNAPDDHMLLAAASAGSDAEDDGLNLSGRFVPHALLTTPTTWPAYALVGTTLVGVGFNEAKAWLVDVERGEVFDILDLVATDDNNGAMAWSETSCIQYDPRWQRVFVATQDGVAVFSNEQSEEGDLARTTQRIACIPDDSERDQWDVLRFTTHPRLQGNSDNVGPLECISGVLQSLGSSDWLDPEATVTGIRVSPCGQHLVMMYRGHVLFVPHFMRPDYHSHIQAILLLVTPTGDPQPRVMDFDGDRIAVGTDTDLYVFTVDRPTMSTPSSWPSLSRTAVRLRRTPHERKSSCVQLTSEALWCAWGENPTLGDSCMLNAIDFSRSTSCNKNEARRLASRVHARLHALS